MGATFLPRYACELAERENLYLVSISMPGWGLSDSMPLDYKRSLLDWPQDVNVVLAKEGIDDVFLMGTSTGCVHAASFAHAFPNRVLGVMLNTPTAPHAAVDSHEISPVTALGKWLIGKVYRRPAGGSRVFGPGRGAHAGWPRCLRRCEEDE